MSRPQAVALPPFSHQGLFKDLCQCRNLSSHASPGWGRCSSRRLSSSQPPSDPPSPASSASTPATRRTSRAAASLLLGELNCISCHRGRPTESLNRKQAPILDHVGGRVRVSYLRKFLSDPQATKPGTSMPNLFATDPEREQKVEALVHFLASTGSLKHERSDAKGVTAGRDLYSKVGCVVCHGTRDAVGNQDKVFATSVPLGNLKAKYAVGSLAAFLDNPHGVRPSGRMPKLLNAKEARDVAHYLLQGIKVTLPQGQGDDRNTPTTKANWDKLPDFDKLKAKASGTGAAFDLGIARRGSNYALEFEGFLKIDRDGDLSRSP